MSIMPGIWVNENVSVGNGAGQLLHLTSEGVRYADGASAAVAEWGRQARSGNFDTIPEHFFRVPWSTIEWMEWSHGLDIRFHCASPGTPGITLTYEALSDEQRDEITQRLREVGQRPRDTRDFVGELLQADCVDRPIALADAVEVSLRPNQRGGEVASADILGQCPGGIAACQFGHLAGREIEGGIHGPSIAASSFRSAVRGVDKTVSLGQCCSMPPRLAAN